MTRFLSIQELLDLHRAVIDQSGGIDGIRDLGAAESALAQPRMAFSGQDLYPTLGDKAAALGYSLVRNHPFMDGNKRIGHAAMETFLVLNGFELSADVDEQEQVMLGLAAGEVTRESFVHWVNAHIVARPNET